MALPERSRALELLPRLGYAARGIVYLIVGGFAVLAALGRGGGTTDAKGALQTILQQPLGAVLLGIVAIGLAAFAVWRLAQAVLDADRHGRSAKGLAIRGGLLASAITHAALAVFAVSLIFRWGGGGDSARGWTAWLLAQPFGRWLVGLIGLAVIGAGIAHGVKGWKADFTRRFDMDRHDLRWATPVSRFGLVARGVVFVMIGGFLILAALHANANEAAGLQGALRTLQAQRPYGPVLFGIVAAGLFAFGVYSLIESVYRRIACAQAFAPRAYAAAVRSPLSP